MNGKVEMTAAVIFDQQPESFELPKIQEFYPLEGQTMPEKGISVLYGTKRGASPIVQAHHYEALRTDKNLAVIRFDLRVGKWPFPTNIALDDIGEVRFLELRFKTLAETRKRINQIWNQLLSEEGKPAENFPAMPSRNMHLLDRLVEFEPFDKLTAMAYPVETQAGPAVMATIFDLGAIETETARVFPGIAAGVVLPENKRG